MKEIAALPPEVRQRFASPATDEIVVHAPYCLLNIARHGAKLIEVICSKTFYAAQQRTLTKLVRDDALIVADDDALKDFGTTGVAARVAVPKACELGELAERIVILNGVEHPAAVGSIVRCAVAFGVTSMIVDRATAATFSSESVTVSVGHVFAMRVHLSDDLPRTIVQLIDRGYMVVSTASQATSNRLEEMAFPQRCAVIFGNERNGVEEAVTAASSAAMTIPMEPPVTALPVSCVSAVVLYQMTRTAPSTHAARLAE